MRQKCDTCGEYKILHEDGQCYDCVQDRHELEEWLPEDGYGDDEDDEDEVE